MNQQPETAEAYSNRGEAKRIKGDFDGALADFNRAIELKPDFAVACNNRALIKKRKGDSKGALEDYDKAIALISDDSQSFALIIDKIALTNSEHPILVVELQDEPGQTFRVIASELWGVENNLSIANMGFEEFASRVDNDGIFRGFPK